MTDPDAVIILTTCPDEASAKSLSAALIERRLAACVSIGGVCLSRFPWQGRVDEDRELPLTIKTRRDRLEAMEAAFDELHPYDVPEILALPVVWGHGPYLDWMNEHLDD